MFHLLSLRNLFTMNIYLILFGLVSTRISWIEFNTELMQRVVNFTLNRFRNAGFPLPKTPDPPGFVKKFLNVDSIYWWLTHDQLDDIVLRFNKAQLVFLDEKLSFYFGHEIIR